MNATRLLLYTGVLACLAIGLADVQAQKKPNAATSPSSQLTETGKKLEAKYAAMLDELRAEIKKSLPVIPQEKVTALQKTHAEAEALQKQSEATNKSASEANGVQAKIANWKKYWIGKAQAGIAKAQADLKAATTDAQREAAKKELAKWEQNKADGEKAIREAEAELAKLKVNLPELTKANEAAKEKLANARAAEATAAKELSASVESFLSSEALDSKLVKATVLAWAMPNGLAAFAQQSPDKAALVDSLLADDKLMKEMLIADGAEYGGFGQAMEIYTAIQKASSKAREGIFQRLALATSLEFAKQGGESKAKGKTKDADDLELSNHGIVDPVKRYLHYEKAYLNGELDPAFKTFTTWEYRMVVNTIAEDEILTWGREMLRNYRPDYVTTPNYGWRYSALVKSDVTYGSEGVKNDRPELHQFQNILKDGGVCGRRAFFGRFILRANGIPVWGVTQYKHAALSHWTPKGWVINLGAGFNHSWWDKGDVPMSGADFLLEAQARQHPKEFMKVLRAQWVSRVLGEAAHNDRKHVAGGLWSSMGHYLAKTIAAQEVELKPLGSELAEANQREGDDEPERVPATKEDQKITVGQDGTITIPVVSHGKSSGSGVAMKSFGGGMQLLGSAGFKTRYDFEAPQAGKYTLSARVVTVQENKKISFATNDSKAIEVSVPYTIGHWQQTAPIDVDLKKGHNVLQFEILGAGRLALKDFTLKPVK
ncbi:MAG: hypothetical protein U0792_14460 [Gemmataceae bacterium]